jgi:hypothetical protein
MPYRFTLGIALQAIISGFNQRKAGCSLSPQNIVPTLTVVRIGLGQNVDDPIELGDRPVAENTIPLRYLL